VQEWSDIILGRAMNKHYVNFKKIFAAFHILFALLALLSVWQFILSGKYPWVYRSLLAAYFITGTAILAIFFKTLKPLQKLYFELLFLTPFLLLAFWLFIKAFDRLFFG
jgi:hypothetical protein